MRVPRCLAFSLLATAVITGGCGRRPGQVALAPSPPPAVPGTVTEQPPPPPPPPSGFSQSKVSPTPSEEALFAAMSLDQINASRPLGNAYFDTDQSSLRDDARETLQRNAAWLHRWASTRIVIEGHADERGTSEYNLALGDRRAVAVRDYLVSLGIAPDRVLTVSKGEESPVCRDAHETCWQENRRGQAVVIAK